MTEEEPGEHRILLHKVLFHAGFRIMPTNRWGRMLNGGHPVLQPGASPARVLGIC